MARITDPWAMQLLLETADALQVTPEELLTLMSYETGGTLDPRQPGPTTKWGQHEGLIQWGQPQQREYGVDLSSPEAALRSQLGREGAVVRYALSRGFRPGVHGGLDLYSTINAGSPGRYAASDTAAGGAPGTVADKYYGQMAGHRARAGNILAGLDDAVGPGPTRARAALGLPLATRTPPAGIAEDRERAARDAKHARTMALLGLGQQLLNAA